MRAAVITISTSASRRQSEDVSGPALAARAEAAGCELMAMEVVPDDLALIEDRLHHFCDAGCDFIFTTGGTGFTPDDVTPEATRAVIEREAPGIAEAMRAVSLGKTPMAVLSRAVAGIRGRTLIVNFPGSPKAVDECFGVLEPVLPHAARTLRGESRHGG
jgi:molybdopterin adenylyltransferase